MRLHPPFAVCPPRTPSLGCRRMRSLMAFTCMACLLLIAAGASAAERSLAAENWAALQRLNAEELVAFANGLDGKDGSFDAEQRAAALALAKKLDPGLKLAKEPARKPMAAEDQLADKTTRDAATA